MKQAFAAIALATVGAMMIIAAVARPAATAPASGDAERGRRLFASCAACHAIAANAPVRMGPHLAGIVGRRAGAVPGFRYSAAMRGANLTWTEANLDRWLVRPQAVVPGTSMIYGGMPNAADRAALIAYLKRPTP